MVIKVSALGFKGPHVAYACGQPLGRSMEPRAQHRLATEARAARATATVGSTCCAPAQQVMPSEATVSQAASRIAAWHSESCSSRSSSSSADKPVTTSGGKKAATKPKATPALDAYRASRSRAAPRYSRTLGLNEHARVRALKEEERKLLDEVDAISRTQQRQRARRKVPM